MFRGDHNFIGCRAMSPADARLGSGGLLLDVSPRRVLDRGEFWVAPLLAGIDFGAAELREPLVPPRPPAARDGFRRFEPAIGIVIQRRLFGVHPVVALLLRRGVDHPGDVAAGAQHESTVALEDLGARIGRLPRHDVIFLGRVDERRQLDPTQIHFLTQLDGAAGFAELVLQVGVLDVPAEHRPRQVGVVAVQYSRSNAGGACPFRYPFTTYGQIRSLARSEANTCASSLPLSRPPLPIAFSRSSTPSLVTSRPISPVSEKSSMVVRRVMLAAGCSSRAASTARALASSVPPTQKPRVFTLSALVIVCATSSARITPCSR